MLKKVSQVFSLFFHPLLMPTVGIVLLMYTDSYVAYIPDQAKKMLIIFTGIGTLLLPVVMLPLFFFRGRISDLQLEERKERFYPLIITAVFYLLTYIFFRRIPVFNFLHAFMLGGFLSVLIAALITLRWKISTHMIGLGGITALVLLASFKLNINLYYSLLGLLTASGITASSRVYLKAHTNEQVYAGFLTGLLVMSLTLAIY